MTTEHGLFTGPKEADFKSDIDIKRALLMTDPDNRPTFNTPLPTNHGWLYWSERMQENQRKHVEIKQGEQTHVEISFPDTICLNFIGDIHAGGNGDYERLHQEVEAIVNTPNSYVMLMGDVLDGYFFNFAQMDQIAQVPEQTKYMHSLLSFLGDNNRLLVGWAGDHDSWLKKMGGDVYEDFAERYGAFFMYGVGYVTLNVGETQYKLTGAHRLPGHSMYNRVHPQARALTFGDARGSDIVVSGHTHQKGYAQHSIREFANKSQKVHLINIGAYKRTDDYAQKLGLGRLATEDMYGSSVILHAGRRRVEYYDDILIANKEIVSKIVK